MPTVSNSNVTEYGVIFTPTDTTNYKTATTVVKLVINKASLTITGGTVAEKAYDGQATAPISGLTFSGLVTGETLALNTDYTVADAAYANATVGANKPVTAGTATLTSSDTANNYTLASDTLSGKSITGTITAKPITATISDITAVTYTSEAQTPDFTVTYDGTTLTSTDYTAEYSNNTNAGTGKVTVTLKGNYSGSNVTKKFIITPAVPTVTVAANKTTTRSTSLGNHNDTIVLTATTTGIKSEKPNGSVVFKHGNTTLATVNTQNGVATFNWVKPTAGNITITAEFTANDTNYIKTAETGTHAFKIDKGDQSQLIITEVTGKKFGDAPVTLATTGGDGDGAVTFSVPNSNVLTISGTAATIVAAGTVTVTATKAGDDNYNPVTATYRLTVSNAEQTAPTGLGVVAETFAGNSDGKITGTTTDMEYSTNVNFSQSTSCTGTATTGLAAGTYYVRYTAKTNYNAGAATEVTIAAGAAKTYTITATDSLAFDSVEVGYTQQPTAKTVTVTNTGNQSVVVTLPTATNYAVAATGNNWSSDTPKTVTLTKDGTATFTVQPNASLSVGKHDEIITVSTGSSTSADVAVTFTVEKAPATTPNATFVATSENNGTLSNVTNTMKYSVNGTDWVEIIGTTMTISGVTAANGVKIKEIGNGTTTEDSVVQSITVTQATTPTSLTVTQPSTIGGKGSIAIPKDTHEYKLNTDNTWVTPTADGAIELAAGEYLVRVKAKDTVLASGNFSVTLKPFEGEKADTPAITINYTDKELTSFVNDVSYTIGGDAVTLSNGNLAIDSTWFGQSISIVRKGNTTTTIDSAAQALQIPAIPSAPPASEFAVTQPVKGGSDGTLKGITDKMEYMVGTATTYTGGTGAELTGITDGTKYTIRTKATNSAFASKTVSVTVASKDTATITFENATVPYNGMEQTLKATTTDSSGGTMTYTYAASSGSQLTNGKPQNAGTYTVTATYESTTHTGSATATLTINKVNVTVTADDKTIKTGEKLDSPYPTTVVGLVNKEQISGVAFSGVPSSTDTKGTHEITPSGGTITGGGNGNYTISYATGTLTITLATEVIDTAIASANAAKIGITTNENDPSSVASGTKFVKAAEMKALTDAITTATAAKATVGTATEAQAAATALDNTVAIFKGVIKTGTYTYSGGGGDGGDGGDTTPTPPPTVVTPPATQEQPNPPTNGETKVNGTLDGTGGVTVKIPDENITDAINAAKKQAGQNGISVTVNMQFTQTVGSLTATLSKASLGKLIAEGVKELKLTSDLISFSFNFNMEALKEIQKYVTGDLVITAKKLDGKTLSKEAQTVIGSRPVFDFTMQSGGKSITDFGKGITSVWMPYRLQQNEVAGNVQAVYVDVAGKVQWLTGSSYDTGSKALLFTTSHFSTYGVAYKVDAPKFTDIADHWAKDNIEFVASRGLLSGTSATAFSPDTAMTRGMFVTALGRLAGADVNSYKTSKFTDVSANAYYAPYVNWAAEKSITTGTSTTTFSPDQSITRQEMAVIMQNYAKAMGYTVSKIREATTFADSGNIASWASEAVKSMQMVGVIMGKDGGKFDPTGTATRAEVAAVLHRYVELVIDRATAQRLYIQAEPK